MKKKLLEKIPLEAVMMKKSNKKWVISAEIVDAAGEKVLMVNLYHKELSFGEQFPKYRLFITHKEDLIQEIDTGEWHSRKIESLPDMPYYNFDDAYDIKDTESKKAIEKYIPVEYQWDRDCLRRIRNLQENNRSAKSSRAYKLRVNRIENKMKEVDKTQLPGDFMEFIDDAFSDQRYIFYKSEKNKRYINTFCSHCKTTSHIDTKAESKPKHNDHGICRSCGSSIIYKATGRQEVLKDVKEVIFMQKDGSGFVSRYFDAERYSRQTGEIYKLIEKARVVYDGKGIRTYYNSNGNYNLDKIYWWDRNGGAYNYNVRYGTGILYDKNLDEVLNETTFKYCAIKLLAEHKKGYFINHESFFSHFEGYRFIGYFIKMGLYNLTNDFVSKYWTNTIDKKGKNVFEILKLSKQQVKRLVQMNGDLYTLKILQVEEIEGKKFSDEQLIFFTENTVELDSFEKILNYTTAAKAIKYLKENRLNNKINDVLHDWCDYIDNCNLLKYDLKNDFVLFPRHLKMAHDNAYKAALDIKNKNRDKDFKKIMKYVKEKYSYETKSLAVVIPKTTDEITFEGQQLHHCVGTYIDKVLKGETVILFVRSKDSIDIPFYTMEVKNCEIIQVRGKNNCAMTQPVKQFIESFKKKRLEVQMMQEAV
jgi:DNA-directed RNA polymerase subunit RPC12/RpoP